jgi:toll-interacting protein
LIKKKKKKKKRNMAAVSMEGRSGSASWRSQVMVGDLPPDFLRIMITPQQAQCAQDAHTARMLYYQQNAQAAHFDEHHHHQQQQHPPAQYPVVLPGGAQVSQMAGRLSLTIVEARLTKNYGMTRMDPYCRLRIGHAVFETPTAYNGAKNPRWQKSVQCYLPQNVDTIHLEIFDERACAVDDRIAWADIVISQQMLEGKVTDMLDDWFPLSGKQGEEKEGSINVVLSFVKGSQPMMPWAPGLQPMVMVPGSTQIPPIGLNHPPANATANVPLPTTTAGTTAAITGQHPQQPPPQPPQPPPQQPPPQPASKEDVELIREMFPDVEEEAVKSVLEANGGNKEAAINALLSMQ